VAHFIGLKQDSY